jgi:hypothetical protein
MDDRMRISDADREDVTARLREHFAEGRLNSDELDERIATTLNAKTFGDLRGVMADLPEPATVGAGANAPWAGPQWAGPGGRGWQHDHSGLHAHGDPQLRRYRHRHGPRLLPLAFIVLLAAIILPGAGFVFFAFLKVILLIWLVTMIFGLFAAARFRRHIRRYKQSVGEQRHSWEWPR